MLIEKIDSDKLAEYIEVKVSESVKTATAIDTDKVNVNGKPFYIGPVMVLSDQDVTALKHHVLSSAVMGTVFASLIVTLSDPNIPLIWRACLLGGILTGLQAVLVGVSNVFIVAYELWSKHGRPVPSVRFCMVCIGHFCIGLSVGSLRLAERCLSAAWHAYVNGHVVSLDNGTTVWIDLYGSVVLDTPDETESAL